jgi:DNA-binding LacI/PurR family transcriptional regulator
MAPSSLRAIASEAGVPHSTLSRIVRNDLGASEEVAEAVARVLERWGGELADGAQGIRDTLGGRR